MNNLIKHLIYSDGKQVEIPLYIPRERANQLVVDINDPLSMASVLKYQIDNWSLEEIQERYKSGSDPFTYGSLDNSGEFLSFSFTEDGWQSDFFLNMDCSYEELVFAQSAVKYPELYPLLEAFAKLLIEASEQESASGPWATEETVLGQFLIFELANVDKKYLYLAEDFSCNIEVRCSTNFGREYRYSMEKLYTKWGVTDKMIRIVEPADEIDYDEFWQLVADDDDADDDTKEMVDELLDYWRSGISLEKVDSLITVYCFEEDGLDRAYILKDVEPYYGFKLNLENKTMEVVIANDSNINIDYDDVISLSLSDSFYEQAADLFSE